MPFKQITKEVGEVLGVNGAILSITTFTNLEILLKIILLLISIVYTVDKWWYHKKKQIMAKKRKLNSTNPKYLKTDEKAPKIRREFACETPNGVKVYKIWYI